MNLNDFSYEENDRRYINPQVSLDEQNAFIDNLRSVQANKNAEIKQDTYNLGTAIPSQEGGLGSNMGYFTSRYQTPQTNSMVANLRAAAQAQALNDAMSNELAKAKKRYNDAYRAAAKRSKAGGSVPDTTQGPITPDVSYADDGDFWKEATVGSSEFAGSELTAEGLAKMQNQAKKQSSQQNVSSGGSKFNPQKTVLVNGNQAVVTNSAYGPVLDTGMVSISGNDNIINYLKGKNITDTGGHDLSSTYRLVLGLY